MILSTCQLAVKTVDHVPVIFALWFLGKYPLSAVFGYLDHFLSACFGGSFSFTIQLCVGVLQRVVSQPPSFFPLFCSTSLHNLMWKHNLSIISLHMIHRLMVFLSQWKCGLPSLSSPLLPSLDSLSQNRSPRVLSKPSIYFLG